MQTKNLHFSCFTNEYNRGTLQGKSIFGHFICCVLLFLKQVTGLIEMIPLVLVLLSTINE